MRSLVNVKDILEAANSDELCPSCLTKVSVIQCTVELSKKGAAIVKKLGVCAQHGPTRFSHSVKAVIIARDAAEIAPQE